MLLRISDSALAQACRKLRTNDPTCTILNLSQRFIDNDGAGKLSDALVGNTHLVVLILSGNMISNPSGKLVAALKKTNVKYLYLGKNGIGATGAKALSTLINLKVLDLRYNDIGDDGAAYLSNLLLASSSLATLVLTDNEIESEGMEAITNALYANTSLESLILDRNDCWMYAYKAFRRMIQFNTTLQTLTIDCDKDNATNRDMQVLMNLHRRGRDFLGDFAMLPSVWPYILSKMGLEGVDLMHAVVRGRPDLFARR